MYYQTFTSLVNAQKHTFYYHKRVVSDINMSLFVRYNKKFYVF